MTTTVLSSAQVADFKRDGFRGPRLVRCRGDAGYRNLDRRSRSMARDGRPTHDVFRNEPEVRNRSNSQSSQNFYPFHEEFRALFDGEEPLCYVRPPW